MPNTPRRQVEGMPSGTPGSPHDEDSVSVPPRRQQGSGVGAGFVWRVLAVTAAAGVLIIAALAWTWKTGRVSGVDETVDPSSTGAVAAYAGMVPSGGAEALDTPRSVSSDGSRVFVTEPDAGRISVFSTAGRFVRRLSLSSAGGAYPVDAAAVGDTLYVVDARGKRLLSVPVRGGSARDLRLELLQPTAVAAVRSTLYIADAGSGLWAMDTRTKKLRRIADAEAMGGFAGGIAADGDRLLVTDSSGSRVLAVDVRSGNVRAFGERINLPRGVAVDATGRIWVADVFGGTVNVLDESGALLGSLEEDKIGGPRPPQIQAPQGLAFTPDDGRLWVVDSNAGRVLTYAVSDEMSER